MAKRARSLRRAVRRFADQRLDFDEHRPRAHDARHHARAAGAPRGARPAQEELRRIAHLVHASLVEREDANLVDAAEAILVRAHDAVIGAVLALEIEYGVD